MDDLEYAGFQTETDSKRGSNSIIFPDRNERRAGRLGGSAWRVSARHQFPENSAVRRLKISLSIRDIHMQLRYYCSSQLFPNHAVISRQCSGPAWRVCIVVRSELEGPINKDRLVKRVRLFCPRITLHGMSFSRSIIIPLAANLLVNCQTPPLRNARRCLPSQVWTGFRSPKTPLIEKITNTMTSVKKLEIPTNGRTRAWLSHGFHIVGRTICAGIPGELPEIEDVYRVRRTMYGL